MTTNKPGDDPTPKFEAESAGANLESEPAISILGPSQTELIDKLAWLVLDPTDDDRQTAMWVATYGLIRKFSHKVEQIIASSTDDTKRVASIASLFTQVDQYNQQSCADISPCDARCHDGTNWDDAKDMVQVSFDCYDEVDRMELITNEFSVGIQDKIIHLSSHLTREPTETEDRQRLQNSVRRAIGRRATGCREHWRDKIPYCGYDDQAYDESPDQSSDR